MSAPYELLVRAAFGTDPDTDLSTLTDPDWMVPATMRRSSPCLVNL